MEKHMGQAHEKQKQVRDVSLWHRSGIDDHSGCGWAAVFGEWQSADASYKKKVMTMNFLHFIEIPKASSIKC